MKHLTIPFLAGIITTTSVGCDGCEGFYSTLAGYDSVPADKKDDKFIDSSEPPKIIPDAGIPGNLDTVCKKIEFSEGTYTGTVNDKLYATIVTKNKNSGFDCTVINIFDYAVPLLILDELCDGTPEEYAAFALPECMTIYNRTDMVLRKLYESFKEDALNGMKIICKENLANKFGTSPGIPL